MKNNPGRKVLLIGGSLVVASLVLANTPGVRKWWKEKPVVKTTVQEEVGKKDPVQVALLQELSGWLKPFDADNTQYYFDARLTAVDKTDSAHAMINVEYRFCKNGNEFYLRSGQTETINTEKGYLYIDHNMQKMIGGPTGKLKQPAGIQVGPMYDFLRKEGFALAKKKDQDYTVITMTNPTHVSCKEFTVHYDSTQHRVKKIFLRQAEVTDAMNPDKEKWLTIVFQDWNDDPDVSKYLKIDKYVTWKDGQWTSTAAFRNYDLIDR